MASIEDKTPNEGNGLQINNYDYIEFYVGNASQAAQFYRAIFGFKPVAYAGLETGVRDRVSYVLEQNKIRLVVTSGLDPDGEISEHVRLHGDSVRDIAFSVDDVAQAFETVVANGASVVLEPLTLEDDSGVTVKATIQSFGHTVHSFVHRKEQEGSFMPGYRPLTPRADNGQIGATAIDHVAISVGAGQLDQWVEFYKNVLGFQQSHVEDVYTEYSAMNSKVVQDSTGRIKFPMMEPAPALRRSQIEEFLKFHGGPGVQHLALSSERITDTVKTLRSNNVDFLCAPASYYETLEERVGAIEEDIESVRDLNILVDRDPWGLLMQIFTRPLQGRPTLFFEIIQRQGARGFGGGNIKALFQSIEREQALRGTL